MSLPVAVDNKVEPGLKIESADIKVFKTLGNGACISCKIANRDNSCIPGIKAVKIRC